jgi:hypothetical protein
MKKIIKVRFVILFLLEIILMISLTSCQKRLDPSTVNGIYYGNGGGYYIDFNNGLFSGEVASTTFTGTYTIDKKKIKFNFNTQNPDIRIFQSKIGSVDSYQSFKSGLSLYGSDYEIILFK